MLIKQVGIILNLSNIIKMDYSLINIPWWLILIVVVVVYLMTKKCPSNCTKSGPLGLGCECHGPGGAVVHTGIHIGN